MKKIALTTTLMLALSAGSVFAAPINNLDNEQTAIGVQDSRAFIEHKFSDIVTVSLQEDDIYGQFSVIPNIRLLVGQRDYHDNSQTYGGLALTASLAPKIDGYASLVGGSDFKEMQLGANVNIAPNLDLNLNYRSLMPDQGSDSNRTTVGATFKF